MFLFYKQNKLTNIHRDNCANNKKNMHKYNTLGVRSFSLTIVQKCRFKFYSFMETGQMISGASFLPDLLVQGLKKGRMTSVNLSVKV